MRKKLKSGAKRYDRVFERIKCEGENPRKENLTYKEIESFNSTANKFWRNAPFGRVQ